MPQSTEISFVVFPDGKVDERSLTVAGEVMARELFVSGWLPERFFGAAPRGYAADSLWRGCREKGFKSYTIQIAADGTPKLKEE